MDMHYWRYPWQRPGYCRWRRWHNIGWCARHRSSHHSQWHRHLRCWLCEYSVRITMRYFLYLSIYLVMQVFAWVVTPALPLFARPRWGLIDNANRAGIEPRLPLWLAWFDTPDNSLLGDNKWVIGHPKATYWTMVAWLY